MARRLSDGETALARGVFATAVRLERVRLHRGGFGRFAITLGSRVFLPRGLYCDDFAPAEAAVSSPWIDVAAQALLVHELAHVWQFQTRPLWTLRSWAATLLSCGYGRALTGYRYALPLTFERLNLEQQASAVEHAFLLRRGLRTPAMPQGASLTDYEGAIPLP